MSETFDAGWLALRERVDHRSRSPELTERLRDWLAAGEKDVTIVDLGSGTGSNLRYLSPRLPRSQSWLLIDQDERLLDQAALPTDHPPGSAGSAADTHTPAIRTRIMDLRDLGISEVEGADVVTASALLDLVSAEWIEALAETCSVSRCAALFALTFDGTIAWGGVADPDDGLILSAVNAHQRRQKGLGAAMGPDAGPAAADAFRRRGYRTFTALAPWQLERDDSALALALVTGWVEAAVEQRPADDARIRAWTRRREGTIADGDFALTVGHMDVLALP